MSQSLPSNARTVSNGGRGSWLKKNQKVPMRNTYPQYDLSDLVLDLDAEGSKHVRKYDKSIDGIDWATTVQNCEQLALARRVQGFEDQYKQEAEQYDKTSQIPYDPWQVSDLDIFAYALLDSSFRDGLQPRKTNTRPCTDRGPTSKFERIVETVHRRNGIPRHAQADTASGLPYLMRRQKKHKRSNPDDGGLFRSDIGKCQNAMEMRRIIQIQLSRPGGSKLISSQSHAIARRCQALELAACKTNHRDELEELLGFVNDVTIKLASEGHPVSDNLPGVGLRISGSYGSFPAMQMYFAATDRWRTDHMAPFVDAALARALLFLSLQTSHKKIPSIAQDALVSRVTAYTTLTGYGMCGQTFEMSYQKALRQGTRDPLRHHEHFLHILAELGAFRTIWHIFQKSDAGKAPYIPRENYDWFVTAILRASRNVSSGRIQFTKGTFEQASGDYETDCKLDLQTIMSSSIHYRPKMAKYKETGDESLEDALSTLYDFLEPEEASRRVRSYILAALRKKSITDSMSDLMDLMHGPRSS
ncbi:GPI-anchored cell wall organization protein-domain-containing protein [Apiospora arundinis]